MTEDGPKIVNLGIETLLDRITDPTDHKSVLSEALYVARQHDVQRLMWVLEGELKLLGLKIPVKKFFLLFLTEEERKIELSAGEGLFKTYVESLSAELKTLADDLQAVEKERDRGRIIRSLQAMSIATDDEAQDLESVLSESSKRRLEIFSGNVNQLQTERYESEREALEATQRETSLTAAKEPLWRRFITKTPKVVLPDLEDTAFRVDRFHADVRTAFESWWQGVNTDKNLHRILFGGDDLAVQYLYDQWEQGFLSPEQEQGIRDFLENPVTNILLSETQLRSLHRVVLGWQKSATRRKQKAADAKLAEIIQADLEAREQAARHDVDFDDPQVRKQVYHLMSQKGYDTIFALAEFGHVPLLEHRINKGVLRHLFRQLEPYDEHHGRPLLRWSKNPPHTHIPEGKQDVIDFIDGLSRKFESLSPQVQRYFSQWFSRFENGVNKSFRIGSNDGPLMGDHGVQEAKSIAAKHRNAVLGQITQMKQFLLDKESRS